MEKTQHVLVIRLSAMGDVAMMVPVFKSFSETYPDVKITLLTRGFFAPIFKDLKNVEVFHAEVKGRHKGIRGLKRLARELEELGIDAVADLHNVLRSNVLKVFFKLKGIPVKQIEKGRKGKKALTRSKNKVFKPLKATHQRYADVFFELGYPVNISEVSNLPKQKLSEQVRKLTGNGTEKWIGIAPFAQHEAKTYPEDLMKEVLRQLQKGQNVKVFLFGGGLKEAGILNKWEQEFKNTTNLAGKFSFEEELALISHLDVMLSMDSGNAHMAANFGVPVITLWGLTHPYTGFAPFRQPEKNFLMPDLGKFPAIPTSVYGTKTPKGYEAAMRTIPPAKVVEKLIELLNEPKS